MYVCMYVVCSFKVIPVRSNLIILDKIKVMYRTLKNSNTKMGSLCLFLPCLPIILSAFFKLICCRNVQNLDIGHTFLLPLYKQKLLINDT